MFSSGIDIGGTSIKFGIFDEQLNLFAAVEPPHTQRTCRSRRADCGAVGTVSRCGYWGRCARHAERCARNHYGG